jgi:CheY-like chemotaxis protein
VAGGAQRDCTARRDREKALAAGCDDFDTKPVEMSRLLEKSWPQSRRIRRWQFIIWSGLALQRSRRAAGMKILYVEDNDDNVYMLKNRLSRAGFTVVVATDGAQGIAMATSELGGGDDIMRCRS